MTTSPTNPDVSAEHKSLSASPTPDDSKATSIAEVKDEIVSSDEPAELTIKVESSSSSPVKTESQSYLKINQAVQSSSNSNWSEPEGEMLLPFLGQLNGVLIFSYLPILLCRCKPFAFVS